MKCSNCQASLRAQAIFCDTCGHKRIAQDVSSTLAIPTRNVSKPKLQKATKLQNILIFSSGLALSIGIAWLGFVFLFPETEPSNTTQTTSQPTNNEPGPKTTQTPTSAQQESLEKNSVVVIKPKENKPKVVAPDEPTKIDPLEGTLKPTFIPSENSHPDTPATLNPFSKTPKPTKTEDATLNPFFKSK